MRRLAFVVALVGACEEPDTLRVLVVDQYRSESAVTDVPRPLAPYAIEAYGMTDPPAGALQGLAVSAGESGELLVESASSDDTVIVRIDKEWFIVGNETTLDAGRDLVGRPDVRYGTTTLEITASGLAPVDADDAIVIFAPNVAAGYYATRYDASVDNFPSIGVEQLTSMRIPWRGGLTRQADGDIVYARQLKYKAYDGVVIGGVVSEMASADLAMDGPETDWTGAFTPVGASPRIDVDLSTAEYVAVAAASHATAFPIDPAVSFEQSTAPVAQWTYRSDGEDLRSAVRLSAGNHHSFPLQEYGSLTATPFLRVRTWANVLSDEVEAGVVLKVGESLVGPSSDRIVAAPVVHPPAEVQLDTVGSTLSASQPVRLSWAPPVTGAATRYRVEFVPLDVTAIAETISVHTTETWAVVPPGVFAPGSRWLVSVTAIAAPEASGPLRSVLPWHESSVVHGLYTFTD